MKKLGNIKINPEKLINEDELLFLRGGEYNGCDCKCYTWEGQLVQKIEWAESILENKNFIFISLKDGIWGSYRNSVYNKRTHETIFLKENIFKNDINWSSGF